MRLRLMVISSTFVLAACVPRAGTDYRVTSEVAPAAESNSQIVAEQDLVIEPLPVGAPQMSCAKRGCHYRSVHSNSATCIAFAVDHPV